MADVDKNKGTLEEVNDAYENLLAVVEKYPAALSDRYDFEKNNEDINRKFKVLSEDVEDLVKKSNTSKRAVQVHSGKIDESMAVLDQIEEVKKAKRPVGIDIEETERNLEHLQVISLVY